MPIQYGVPFYPGFVNSPLLPQIAAGPQTIPEFGKTFDAFFAGQDVARKNAQLDLFPQGLPRDPNDPTGKTIDWQKASDMAAKVGGLPALQNILTLQNQYVDPQTQEMLRRLYTPGSMADRPQLRSDQVPPSTSATPARATSVFAPEPAGSPAPPNSNIEPASGSVQRVDIEGSPGQPQPGLTARSLAERTNQDPETVARALGVGVDQPLDPQEVRAKLDRVRGAALPLQAPTETPTVAQFTQNPVPAPPSDRFAPPVQVAQAAPTPQITRPTIGPVATDAQIQDLERRANLAAALGQSLALKDPKRAQDLMTYSQSLFKQLSDLQAPLGKARGENIQLTPAQKEAGDPSVLRYKGLEDIQKQDITEGNKKYTGIIGAEQQYQRDQQPYNQISRAILSDPTMYTGIGGQHVYDWNKIRAVFGDQKAAQLQATLEKVTAASVLSQINSQKDQMAEAGQQGGRLFSAQVDQVVKASPGLETTLAGNRTLVELSDRMGGLTTRVAQMARDYRNNPQGPGYLDKGFDQQLSNYLKRNPLFTQQELAHPEILGAPSVPQAIAANPAAIAQWGSALGLRPGQDAIRFPSGKVTGFSVVDKFGRPYQATQ